MRAVRWFPLLAGLVVSGVPRPLLAEDAGTGPSGVLRLTVAEAVTRALAASPQVAWRRALERAAAADLRGAQTGRLPMLDLSGGYSHQSNVPELTMSLAGGRTQTLFPNLPENYRARIGGSWLVFSGGRVAGAVEAADREREASGRDVLGERQDTALETQVAYWRLVTARQVTRVLREAARAYDAHLNDAENRERVGMAARNETLAVRVERERAELALLRAENAAASAAANLARLIDLVGRVEIEPVETLEMGGSGDVAPLEELVATALASRPERAALLARVAAAEARVRVERGARWPQVVASGGYDYANPNRRIMPPSAVWKDSWDVGVSASLALFDGGRASSGVARARARRDAQAAQLQDLERRVRLQVTQRALDLRAAKGALEVAERAIEAARENQRVAAERYRAGLIPSSELLDAEVALLRAGLDRTESLAEARLAVAGLDRAVGREP